MNYYPQAAMTLRVIWEDFNFKSDARLQKVYTLPILARRLTVNINDYSQADTFDAEIDFKQFPFDPRAIRSMGVTIHMKDMKKIFKPDNGLSAIEMNRDNAVFIGFADEESIKFDDTRRTVRFEGRDYTALLIDRKYLGGPDDLNLSVDKLIAKLLAELKETVSIELDNRVEGSIPSLGIYSPHANTNPNLGARRSQAKDESYWDVIQDIVARAGLIAYIELDKLVLSKPRVLYDKKQAKKFIYGKNLKDLEFKRQIGRKKNFNIVVRSLNTNTKEVLEANIPAEATAEWSKATGIPQAQIMLPVINADGSKGTDKPAPTLAFRVPNINNKDQLIKVGQELYEELGRQQLDGSFSTRDLETADGVGACFDMFKLRNGTPVSITIDQGDLKGIQKLSSQAEKAKFLRLRGYEPSVAEALAQTMSNPRFNSPFYTKAVTFTLDQDTGVTIKVEFVNFIETPERLGGNGA